MLRECTGSTLPSVRVAGSGSQEEWASLTLTGGHTNGEGEVGPPLNELERTESTSCVCMVAFKGSGQYCFTSAASPLTEC